MFNILSMSGGGVRGIITAIVIENLSKKFEGFLDKVDLCAGTSTGGLLALGIAAGLDTNTIIETYIHKDKIIFADSILDDIGDLGNIVGAKYNIDGLVLVLKDIFGDMRIKDLQKKICVATFDVINHKPKFYTEDDPEELVYEVGVKTAAAPTYFPIYKGHVDGGVHSPNPCLAGLTEALKEGYKLEEILELSLGTGGGFGHGKKIKGNEDWGIADWALKGDIISIMMDSEGLNAVTSCRVILKDKFFYHDCGIKDSGVAMDEYKRNADMIKLANEIDLLGIFNWLNNWRD